MRGYDLEPVEDKVCGPARDQLMARPWRMINEQLRAPTQNRVLWQVRRLIDRELLRQAGLSYHVPKRQKP